MAQLNTIKIISKLETNMIRQHNSQLVPEQPVSSNNVDNGLD